MLFIVFVGWVELNLYRLPPSSLPPLPHQKANAVLAKVMDGDLQIESFFEGCRLMVEKAIALEGFLLLPVQRICRYPLMLKELLKHTPDSHGDKTTIESALGVMQDMAKQINEEKRYKEEILRLQQSFDSWPGKPLSECCSQLVFEGDLMKVSGSHMQDRHFFLFDNLFVYGKRMLRNRWSIKGKIFTDNMTVIDIDDGAMKHRNTPLVNAIRIRNESKKKWCVLLWGGCAGCAHAYAFCHFTDRPVTLSTPRYVLVAGSVDEKQQWLDAFLRERALVEKAAHSGLSLVNQLVDDEDDSRQRSLGEGGVRGFSCATGNQNLTSARQLRHATVRFQTEAGPCDGGEKV